MRASTSLRLATKLCKGRGAAGEADQVGDKDQAGGRRRPASGGRADLGHLGAGPGARRAWPLSAQLGSRRLSSGTARTTSRCGGVRRHWSVPVSCSAPRCRDLQTALGGDLGPGDEEARRPGPARPRTGPEHPRRCPATSASMREPPTRCSVAGDERPAGTAPSANFVSRPSEDHGSGHTTGSRADGPCLPT